MDSERLEEIKKELELDWSDISYVVNQVDVKWLINRVEELEERVKDLKIMLKVLGKQNQRYREALEFYADRRNYGKEKDEYGWFSPSHRGITFSNIHHDDGAKARKALEWETE